MSPRASSRRRPACRGLTLVELVVAIALIGLVAATLVSLFGRLAGHSADALVQRQSLAIAESMLEEILAQGTGTTDQGGGPDAPGPEAGESRTGGGLPFDHVDDYDGLAMNGVTAADGSALPGLAGYRVAVSVQARTLGTPASAGWWIAVTVTGPDGTPVQLCGWRATL